MVFNATASVSMLFRMILIRTSLYLYIWYKMLSSYRNVLLKLPETTSPTKLFPSDCITLYDFNCLILLWCNQITAVLAVVSSWVALTWHLGMKTAYFLSNTEWKTNILEFFLWWFKFSESTWILHFFKFRHKSNLEHWNINFNYLKYYLI